MISSFQGLADGADQGTCRFADKLIDPAHILAGQSGNGTVIGHADKQRSTLGIGKGRHFRGQGSRIANIRLELAGAVFAAGNLFKRFSMEIIVSFSGIFDTVAG